MRTNLFGIIALGMGQLTQEQLTYALEVQRQEDKLRMPHRRLGAVCCALGFLTEEQADVVMERIRVLGLPLIFGQRPMQPQAEFDLAEVGMDILPEDLDSNFDSLEDVDSPFSESEPASENDPDEDALFEITQPILLHEKVTVKIEEVTPSIALPDYDIPETRSLPQTYLNDSTISFLDAVDKIAALFPCPAPHETHVSAVLFRELLAQYREAQLQIRELRARVKEGKDRSDILHHRLGESEREIRELHGRLGTVENFHPEEFRMKG